MSTADDLTTGGDDAQARRVLRKVTVRLVPFLCLLYLFNILDRSNVGFARLTMQSDLGIEQAIFDLGIGFFYVGYLVFEVPSNLVMRRIGARRWIARIMVSWGLVSCATLAVRGEVSFYLVRFLLGVAEAGFFPGIILYLTYWFPQRERARITAYFMGAIALASVVGNPVSGAILQYTHQAAGLKGWQWLFLLEGLPSVLLGFTVLWWLTDRPEEARWLEPEERTWLTKRIRDEEASRRQRHGADHLGAMLQWRVWLLIGLYVTVATTANASGGYFPTLIKKHFPEAEAFHIGLLGALPHLSALAGMTLTGTLSDRTGERCGFVAGAALVAGTGWLLAAWAEAPALALVGLCLAQTGMMSMLATFWAIPTGFLTGAAAAGGIALINSVANIGGAVGPWLLGKYGLELMAAFLFAGVALALVVRYLEKPGERRHAA